jgi:hypothetical protein
MTLIRKLKSSVISFFTVWYVDSFSNMSGCIFHTENENEVSEPALLSFGFKGGAPLIQFSGCKLLMFHELGLDYCISSTGLGGLPVLEKISNASEIVRGNRAVNNTLEDDCTKILKMLLKKMPLGEIKGVVVAYYNKQIKLQMTLRYELSTEEAGEHDLMELKPKSLPRRNADAHTIGAASPHAIVRRTGTRHVAGFEHNVFYKDANPYMTS